MRKQSLQPSTAGDAKKLIDLEVDEVLDYAPAFRKKKMSVQHRPANATFHGGRLNADGSIRFKKVGNLLAVEKTYSGAAPRLSSLNKTGNANLFFRHLLTEHQTP